MAPASAGPALCLVVFDGPLRFIRRGENTRGNISVNLSFGLCPAGTPENSPAIFWFFDVFVGSRLPQDRSSRSEAVAVAAGFSPRSDATRSIVAERRWNNRRDVL